MKRTRYPIPEEQRWGAQYLTVQPTDVPRKGVVKQKRGCKSVVKRKNQEGLLEKEPLVKKKKKPGPVEKKHPR